MDAGDVRNDVQLRRSRRLERGVRQALVQQSSTNFPVRALRDELCEEWKMKLNEVPMSEPLIGAGLPPQAISEEVLLEKYAKGGERTVDEVRRR